MTILPTCIYRFNTVPSKAKLFSYRNWQIDPEIHMEAQGTQKRLNIHEKKKITKLEVLYLLIAKLNIKPQLCILWHWHKERYVNQWNRIQSSEINFYIYDQSILTRIPRQLNRERIFFSTNGIETTGYLQEKEWSCTPTSHHIKKLTHNRSKI